MVSARPGWGGGGVPSPSLGRAPLTNTRSVIKQAQSAMREQVWERWKWTPRAEMVSLGFGCGI